MNKVTRILGHQSLTYKSVKTMREKMRVMHYALVNYKVNLDVKNDFDYFCLEVVYESFLNKHTFETTYESLRSELFDAWEHAEHELKKHYIDLALEPHKKEMKYFYDENGKIIRIAFFDELLNQLYENDMVIFERPQYFKLENHFSDKMQSVLNYDYRPFEANFSSARYLTNNEDSFVLFSDETKCLYHHTNDETIVYPLYKHTIKFEDEKLMSLANTLLTNDEKAIAQAIIDSGYLNRVTEMKLKRFIVKG